MALNLLKFLPTPTDPCGRVQYGIRGKGHENVYIGKVDYHASDKHSMFGRYMVAHAGTPSHYDPSDPARLLTTAGSGSIGAFTTYPVANDWRSWSFAVGDTYLIGTGIVSSFRATLVRPINSRGTPPKEVAPEEIGIRGIYQPPELINRFTTISVAGGFSIGGAGGNIPGLTNSTAYQLSEDMSWLRGDHQIGFGANYIHSLMNSISWTNNDGAFNFSAQNTGAGLGDYMLGRVNTFAQSDKDVFYFRANYVSLYLQDTWKATSRLTVNAGLRWDPFIPLAWKDGQMVHFDQKWFDQGIRSTVYKNAPIGVLYSGDPGVPDNGKVGPNEYWNFSPRLGLAWDPKGDGRMTVRAAYGLFRDYPEFYKFHYTRKSPPWASTINLQSPPNFADPWGAYPGGNPFPVVVSKESPFTTNATFTNRPLDLPSVYVHQWNLSLQKQLAADWLVSGNYIGNSVIHLLNKSEGNPAMFLGLGPCTIAGVSYTTCSTTANTTARRKLNLQNPDQGKFYGNIVNMDAGGTMSYNGMLLTVQHRAASGLTVTANYTWSHCINTGTSQLIMSTGGYTPERRGANRGNCVGMETDRRHNFNMSTVYSIPQFANRTVQMLAGGWQVSGIVKILTGSYLTVSSGIDNALSATNDNRPDQILASPYADNPSINQWLNPAAFAQPVTGTYGNMGANNVHGPGSIGIDMGLKRNFRIREGHSIEFRAEAFNLPNHVNPGNPVTNFTNSDFGKIQSANDPRIMQLALKYVF